MASSQSPLVTIDGQLSFWRFKDIGSLRKFLGLTAMQTKCLAPKQGKWRRSKECTKGLAKAATERIERNLNRIMEHDFPSDTVHECLLRLAISCICNNHRLKDDDLTTPEEVIYHGWHGNLWSECVLLATGGPLTGVLAPPPLFDRKGWNDALARIPKLQIGTTPRQACKSEDTEVGNLLNSFKQSSTSPDITTTSSSLPKESGLAGGVETQMRPMYTRAVARSHVPVATLSEMAASQQHRTAAISSSGSYTQPSDSIQSFSHRQSSPQEDIDEPQAANAEDEVSLVPLPDESPALISTASPDSMSSVGAKSIFSMGKSEGPTPASDYGSERLEADKVQKSDAKSPLQPKTASSHGFPAIERQEQKKKVGILGDRLPTPPSYSLKPANSAAGVSLNDDPFVTVSAKSVTTADKATNTDPVATADKATTTDPVTTADQATTIDQATTTTQATTGNSASCNIKLFKHKSSCKLDSPDLESLDFKYDVEECRCNQSEITELPISEKTFTRYGHEFDGPKFFRKLLKKLCSTLHQESRSVEGWIYGYMCPGWHGYIKIGKETIPGQRLKDWQSQCRCNVAPVFRVRMPYAADLMEELIRLTLWQSRKVNHHCVLVETPTCPVKVGHNEWFQITIEDALKHICLWQRFSISQPYDDEGRLKKIWYTPAHTLLRRSMPTVELPRSDQSPGLWFDMMPDLLAEASLLTPERPEPLHEVSLVISLKNSPSGQRVEIAKRTGGKDVLIKSLSVLELS